MTENHLKDGPDEIAMDVDGYVFKYVPWPHREVYFQGNNDILYVPILNNILYIPSIGWKGQAL